jgi:hypothetical protein
LSLRDRLLERWRLSPVHWANFGPVSRMVAAATLPSRRPVLIIAHPRSGSTWVGATLGSAADALYLKEPLTLTRLRSQSGTVTFELPDSGPPEAYLAPAAAVDIALPAFPPNIVPFPDQWSLGGRRGKRLVIKEVNPLALDWFVRRWAPKIVYLLRHPAGVAASFAAQGWRVGQEGFAHRFRSDRFASGEIAPERHAGSMWREIGAVQALVLKLTLQRLQGEADWLVVRYEDLCDDPIASFRQLYDFADLKWSDKVEERIQRETGAANHDRSLAYDTTRNSQLIARAWKSDLAPDEIAELRDAYLFYEPCYYRPEDW